VHTVIPALGRQRQEDLKFIINVGYVARTCLKIYQCNKTQRIRNYSELFQIKKDLTTNATCDPRMVLIPEGENAVYDSHFCLFGYFGRKVPNLSSI
jgi:hypothetical protein